jgi:hypothetical protein
MTRHDNQAPAACGRDTGQTARLITDRLAAQGFGVRVREWGEVQNLTIVGVRQARSCLTVADDGHLRWDYQPEPGPRTSPAALARIVLHILGAEPADGRPLDDGAYPAFPLKGATGRLLQDHGLVVQLLTCEDTESFDVVAEISVTRPGRPERGTVKVNDDGDIEWGCQARQAFGGDAGAVVAVVAPVLRREPASR